MRTHRGTNLADETRLLTKHIKIYNEIHQIGKLFNNLYANLFVSSLFTFGSLQLLCTIQLFKMALKIDSLTRLECQISAFYFLVVINASSVINSLFGICGQVHHESCHCLSKLKVRIHRDPKLTRKYLRVFNSLPKVKVEFGWTNNFIEKQTPIIYQQFTVQRILDYILMNFRNSA